MAPSKLRKAIGAVKDRTSISLAKVGNSDSMSDLDVAIVKATRHEEYPSDERHIREIITITGYSRRYVSACVNTLSRRLNKTKTWTVALKTLMLIHRLLQEGDPAYETEIFFSTRRGTRMLNMSDFRDKKRYGSWDYSAFVRTYALYLDEQLEFRMHGRKRRRPGSYGGDEDDDQLGTPPSPSSLRHTNTPVRDMKTDSIFTRAQHLQQLLERFLACRPTGPAKENRVVLVALYPVVKESFNIYYDLTEIMGILIERFMQLKVSDCAKVYDIFSRIAKQFDELDTFYNWCKTVAIARSSEYPEVEKIEARKLEKMDEFIRDKANLAEESYLASFKSPIVPQNEVETPRNKQQVVEKEEVVEEEEAIKALPEPTTPQDKVEEENNKHEIHGKEEEEQIEADLLNLKGDHQEEQGDRLALALFDGGDPTSTNTGTTEWVAFPSDDRNWEITLVETASNLKNQKTSLAGGFDALLLDGMYQQQQQIPSNAFPSGSASSVALPVGKPATMLALPAPPVSGASNSNADPFAASLSVAPPPYVQMSEMETKQKLLVEEQLMWQQYANDGMKATIQQNPTSRGMRGGYTRI